MGEKWRNVRNGTCSTRQLHLLSPLAQLKTLEMTSKFVSQYMKVYLSFNPSLKLCNHKNDNAFYVFFFSSVSLRILIFSMFVVGRYRIGSLSQLVVLNECDSFFFSHFQNEKLNDNHITNNSANSWQITLNCWGLFFNVIQSFESGSINVYNRLSRHFNECDYQCHCEVAASHFQFVIKCHFNYS